MNTGNKTIYLFTNSHEWVPVLFCYFQQWKFLVSHLQPCPDAKPILHCNASVLHSSPVRFIGCMIDRWHFVSGSMCLSGGLCWAPPAPAWCWVWQCLSELRWPGQQTQLHHNSWRCWHLRNLPSEAQMQLPSKTCQMIKKNPCRFEVDMESVFDLGYLESPAKQYQIAF